MAKVTADLPRPKDIVVVDSRDLVEDEPSPAVNPDTGVPASLKAFVVLKDPRITVVPNFLTHQECEHLLRLSEGYWMPSLVGQAAYTKEEDKGKNSMENKLSQTRTSWSCMLRYSQTSVVERIEHRLSALTGLPTERLERMNMVRYSPGELFDEHHDGKFRPMTVFVYLNDLPEADDTGDTFFPVLGVSFKPRRGTAVVWFNAQSNGQEDSRMLHAGRAPSLSVKYGVNCFFNDKDMRHLAGTGAAVPIEEATLVHIGNLANDAGERPNSASGRNREEGAVAKEDEEPRRRALIAYRLSSDPSIVAVPDFLNAGEVASILSLASQARPAGAVAGVPAWVMPVEKIDPDGETTHTVRVLCPAETPLVEGIEARLAGTAGLSLDNLAGMRVVRPGARPGYCNRGCGPKSGYICLSDEDEIFLYRLGLRFKLRKGDLLLWSNVDWETGSPVEDIRTLRVHPRGAAPALGLDVFFHDNPLRQQQALRRFVSDVFCEPTVQADHAADCSRERKHEASLSKSSDGVLPPSQVATPARNS